MRIRLEAESDAVFASEAKQSVDKSRAAHLHLDWHLAYGFFHGLSSMLLGLE